MGARVTRRLDGADAAQMEYLRALEIYARLPAGDDLSEFLSEHCEVLGESESGDLSPGTLGLLADIAEEKFGTGSDEHLEVLRQIADVCVDAGRPELAAPALACRARALQAGLEEPGGSWGRGEAEAAVEEAAKALEAALPVRLENGDLEGAIEVWQEAIAFRECLEGPTSEVTAAMRKALEALVQALGKKNTDVPDAIHGDMAIDNTNEDDDVANISSSADPTKERWDDDAEEEIFAPPPRPCLAAVSGTKSAPKPKLTGDAGDLRPAWMQATSAGKAGGESAPKAAAAAAMPAAHDAWD